jgi:5'-AMP-activated protein kinase regulatory beta subunit
MGQANSSRERHKSGDIQPCSPGKDGQAFVFDKKPNKLLYQTSGDDDDYLNAKVTYLAQNLVNFAKNNQPILSGF